MNRSTASTFLFLPRGRHVALSLRSRCIFPCRKIPKQKNASIQIKIIYHTKYCLNSVTFRTQFAIELVVKRSKTHNRLKERFFNWAKQEKRANFRGSPCQDPAGNMTTRRPDHRKETQTPVVWTCPPFIRSGQNHLARHSQRGNKTRQTDKEVGRQHQGMDRPGVRQVPEGSG